MKKYIVIPAMFLLSIGFVCAHEKPETENPLQENRNNTLIITEIKTIKVDTVKPIQGFTNEKDLLEHFKKLPYWAFYNSNNGVNNAIDPFDSLERENILFQAKLLDYTSKHPETISNNFKEFVKEGL